MESWWFISLISAVCLEGLGRKYLPQVPGFAFYFLKDLILIFGYLRMPPSSVVRGTVKYLYRGFGVFWVGGLLWTVVELVNPGQTSGLLAVVGLRAYWVWWFAPPMIASVLLRQKHKERAIYALLILTVVVAVLGALQFAAPADSSINLYQVQNGEEIHASDMAVVASTGRARVSSTFTFVSGFVAFTILVPTLLLSIGLDSENPRLRKAALMAAAAAAAVIPMSGSRSSIVMAVLVLLATMWTGGLFFTRMGRRVLLGAIAGVVVSAVVFPDAIFGVQSRFEQNEGETAGRMLETLDVLPPVILLDSEYPIIGIGTGMQQNVRFSIHVETDWNVEGEYERYLVELGPVGYLLIWCARLGLMVALLRSYGILKKAGRRGSAGAALSYAVVAMFGSMAFDHNWQALYFIGCGFILAEVVEVRRAAVTQRVQGSAFAESPAPAPASAVASTELGLTRSDAPAV
jgi:hypothetical protein